MGPNKQKADMFTATWLKFLIQRKPLFSFIEFSSPQFGEHVNAVHVYATFLSFYLFSLQAHFWLFLIKITLQSVRLQHRHFLSSLCLRVSLN